MSSAEDVTALNAKTCARSLACHVRTLRRPVYFTKVHQKYKCVCDSLAFRQISRNRISRKDENGEREEPEKPAEAEAIADHQTEFFFNFLKT